MLTKGSIIKLEKPMGMFTNIGELCEVTSISEDGSITFKFGKGMHLGCMSYNEYEKYFSLVENKKPVKKWGNWVSAQEPIKIETTGDSLDYEYRTNGRKVQCRFPCENGSIMSESCCNKSDRFDYSKGLELTKERLKVKLMEMLF